MLLRYRGVNPHPDYTTLQNQFATLGFPRQGGIRNIAIINANQNGGRQVPVNEFDPGDRLLEAKWGLTEKAEMWTNRLNANTTGSSIRSSVFAINNSRSYAFDAFNYDIVAGGIEFSLRGGATNLG